MPGQVVSRRDEMTAEWFTSILRRVEPLRRVTVENVVLEPVSGGVMTNMVRAKLTYAGVIDAPASLLVKFPSEDEGNLQIAKVMGLYELEVRFYQDIAPLLPKLTVPKCYLAELDDTTGRFALVLEDLGGRVLSGVTLSTISPAQCSAVFAELVNLQAPHWNSPTLNKIGWLGDPRQTQGVFDAIALGLDPFLNRFGSALTPQYARFLETVLPLAGKWARSWQAPTVLQHGEFRAANVLFGAAAEAPAATIIDFQTVRLGPPGIDPAYFMGGSMPADDRRGIERGLIEEYHRRLVAAGVEGFGWDECWRAYREGAMYGVYLIVGMAGQVEPSERNDQIILDLATRFVAMALDHDAPVAAGLA